MKLYRSAASEGYADAENLLGILLATGGDGVPQDDAEAVVWYRKAADQGFAKAQKNLGDMYFFGRGVDKDYQQATTWYAKAADQQFADAQYRLGFMSEKGLGTQQSDQAAVDLYQKAARNGSVEAQRAYDRLSPKGEELAEIADSLDMTREKLIAFRQWAQQTTKRCNERLAQEMTVLYTLNEPRDRTSQQNEEEKT